MVNQDTLDRVLLDRFQGCLLGVAIGDALGAPVEFCTHYDIEKRYGVLKDMVGGGWLKLEPGQWTDDTAQTLALAETYVARRTLDFEDFTQRLLDWFDGNPPDVGNQTRKVLEYLREYPARTIIAARKFWYHSNGVTAGNGSLMRCAPTALFRCHNIEELVRESILASQITHFDPRCCEACVVANFVIEQCLLGRFSPDLTAQTLLFYRSLHQMPLYHSLVANYETGKMKEGEPWSMAVPYVEAMDSVEKAIREVGGLNRLELKSTGYVVDTLQSALHVLMNAPSFSEGLVMAVNLGGDADTLGAVAGAMLGARFGFSQIPTEWVAKVKESERILNIAEILFQVAPPAPAGAEPPKMDAAKPATGPTRPATGPGGVGAGMGAGASRPATGQPRPQAPPSPMEGPKRPGSYGVK